MGAARNHCYPLSRSRPVELTTPLGDPTTRSEVRVLGDIYFSLMPPLARTAYPGRHFACDADFGPALTRVEEHRMLPGYPLS
jgi:hypothetical protein